MLTDVHFTELPVTDQDRALKFYTEKLGCTVHTDAPYTDTARWIMLKLPGGGTTLIHFAKRRTEVDSTLPDLTVLSNEIQADFARLEQAGVVCLYPPTEAPWNPHELYFQCRDSEGNLILVQQVDALP